jgi:hypothetical protein
MATNHLQVVLSGVGLVAGALLRATVTMGMENETEFMIECLRFPVGLACAIELEGVFVPPLAEALLKIVCGWTGASYSTASAELQRLRVQYLDIVDGNKTPREALMAFGTTVLTIVVATLMAEAVPGSFWIVYATVSAVLLGANACPQLYRALSIINALLEAASLAHLAAPVLVFLLQGAGALALSALPAESSSSGDWVVSYGGCFGRALMSFTFGICAVMFTRIVCTCLYTLFKFQMSL